MWVANALIDARLGIMVQSNEKVMLQSVWCSMSVCVLQSNVNGDATGWAVAVKVAVAAIASRADFPRPKIELDNL